MAQKIQFIVTVLHRPKLLIFDEPFSGFDPINANIIKDEILKLKEDGTSIIFSTHRMESVEELCEYIALIHKSEKVLDGKLSEIKKAYKNNVFEVSMEMEGEVKKTADFLDQKFEVLTSHFDDSDNRHDLKIKLPSNDTRNVLSELTKYGNITRFEEVIPSANDIFIQTVNEKEGNG